MKKIITKCCTSILVLAMLCTIMGELVISQPETVSAMESDDPLQGRAQGYVDAGFENDINENDIYGISQCSIEPRETLAGLDGIGLVHNSRFDSTTKRIGIDVSHFQADIDWAKAKAAGVSFAFIRVGYRGYGSGSLVQDRCVIQNLNGAINAGIKVGVYIFSQALNTTEAEQEADYVAKIIAGYNIELPVVMDYEYACDNDGQTGRLFEAKLSVGAATANVNAFARRIRNYGYTSMVYANKDFLESQLNASALDNDTYVWLANYRNQTNYSGKYTFWQHTSTGRVDGIHTNVDCNIWYDDGTLDIDKTGMAYSAHIADFGWQQTRYNGAQAGTTGLAKRIEALKISVNNIANVGVEYRSHVEGLGWENEWKRDGQISGTTGKGKRVEAFQIRLTGTDAEKYDIYYCAHVEGFGWLNWTKNGESAGTTGYAKRIEAIKTVIVKKGSPTPSNLGNNERACVKPLVVYSSHVRNIGWQGGVKDGIISGTTGKNLRMEGIQISLDTPEQSGDIQYKTHVQDYGWENAWKHNGEISGTTGKAKQIEAIQIQLTGEMSNRYDVYYRAHCQNIGWTGWASNGLACGTTGYAYQMEAVQIVLIPKGSIAPGATTNIIYSR